MEPEDWAYGLISGMVLIAFGMLFRYILVSPLYVMGSALVGVGIPFVGISGVATVYTSYKQNRIPFRS